MVVPLRATSEVDDTSYVNTNLNDLVAVMWSRSIEWEQRLLKDLIL